MILDALREFNAASSQFRHGLGDVVTIERDVGRPGRAIAVLRWMNAKVGLRCVKDEPSSANVSAFESEFVANECEVRRAVSNKTLRAFHGSYLLSP